MRIFFIILHALLFIFCVGAYGLSIFYRERGEFMLIPALLLVFICLGLKYRSRLTIIPAILILLAATVVTFFMVAGNIAWPEKTIMTILLIYLMFFLVEMVLVVFLIFFMKKEVKYEV